MIQELVFTSAPKGLKLGSSGFCTVASTPGMAPNLAKQLQGLSAYRHLNSPGSTGAKSNPVVYSHVKIKIGGKWFSILSRIADAGLDYSNRSNKLAHHFAVENTAALKEGPSSLLKNESQFFVNWNQDPTKLEPRSLVGSNSSARACHTWKTVTGDGGWAGDVIEAVQKKKTVYLIVSPTTPVLELIDEVLALLPFKQQWDLTFSTFYTKTSGNIECNVRCVMDGSPEVALARRSQSNVVIDLTSNQGMSKSEFAGNARHGITFEEKKRTSTPIGSELSKIEPDLANFFKPDLNEQINSETPSLDSKINANPPVLTPGLEGYRTYQESSPPTLTTSYRPEETPNLPTVAQSKSKYPLVVFCAVLLALAVGLIFWFPQVQNNLSNVLFPKSSEPKGTEPKGTESKGTESKGTESKGTEPKSTELDKVDGKNSKHSETDTPPIEFKTYEDIKKLQTENDSQLEKIKNQVDKYKKNPGPKIRKSLENLFAQAVNINPTVFFQTIDKANTNLQREVKKANLEEITKPEDIEYAYDIGKEKLRQLEEVRKNLEEAKIKFEDDKNKDTYMKYVKICEDAAKRHSDKKINGQSLQKNSQQVKELAIRATDLIKIETTNFGVEKKHIDGGKIFKIKDESKTLDLLTFDVKYKGKNIKITFNEKSACYEYSKELGEYKASLLSDKITIIDVFGGKLEVLAKPPTSNQIMVNVGGQKTDTANKSQTVDVSVYDLEPFEKAEKLIQYAPDQDLLAEQVNKPPEKIGIRQNGTELEIYWLDKDGTELGYYSEAKENYETEKSLRDLRATAQKLSKYTLKQLEGPPTYKKLDDVKKQIRKINSELDSVEDRLDYLITLADGVLNTLSNTGGNPVNGSAITQAKGKLNNLKNDLRNFKNIRTTKRSSLKLDKDYFIFDLAKKKNSGNVWVICFLDTAPTTRKISAEIKVIESKKPINQRTKSAGQQNGGVMNLTAPQRIP